MSGSNMNRRKVRRKKSAKADIKKSTIDRLAERVFVTFPRILSFSHRTVGSLRHPYLVFAQECIKANISAPGDRVNALLEAILDAQNEAGKWQRVGSMFDSKLSEPVIDKMRETLLLSPDIIGKIEAIWVSLGGSHNSLLCEDAYRQFHQQVYFIVLEVDDVSIIPATMGAISDDFSYDCRGYGGVPFGSFALSLLELADNWTETRDAEAISKFMQCIIDQCISQPKRSVVEPHPFNLKREVFFSGGILAKRNEEGYVQYYKTTS